jgi:hypothetical protein
VDRETARLAEVRAELATMLEQFPRGVRGLIRCPLPCGTAFVEDGKGVS